MTLCLECGEQARWRDDRGPAWCSSHLPNSGQFKSLRQEVAEVRDILDELEAGSGDPEDTLGRAAAEIRRLRAALGDQATHR